MGLGMYHREDRRCMVTKDEPKSPENYCNENRYIHCPDYARAFLGLSKEALKKAIKEQRPITDVIRTIISEEIKKKIGRK